MAMTSIQSRFLRGMLKSWARRAFDRKKSLEEQRTALEKFASRMPMPRMVQIEPRKIGDMHGEWLHTREGEKGGTILYLHGGAYKMGSCITSRALAGRIALAAGMDALLIDYRLAPEDPFPAALEDAKLAYNWLLEKEISADKITLVGESCGGGLALSTMLALREANRPLPSAAVCMSPWVDLANSGESYQSRLKLDPWGLGKEDYDRSTRMYAGEHYPCDPLISPIYGDLHGLPPMLVQVGDHEVLRSDSIQLAEKAERAGVEVRLEVWDGMWHVFQATGEWMPESKRAIKEIGELIRNKGKGAGIREAD
jgi:monoterpene epsilon-lactone hydrolase